MSDLAMPVRYVGSLLRTATTRPITERQANQIAELLTKLVDRQAFEDQQRRLLARRVARIERRLGIDRD